MVKISHAKAKRRLQREADARGVGIKDYLSENAYSSNPFADFGVKITKQSTPRAETSESSPIEQVNTNASQLQQMDNLQGFDSITYHQGYHPMYFPSFGFVPFVPLYDYGNYYPYIYYPQQCAQQYPQQSSTPLSNLMSDPFDSSQTQGITHQGYSDGTSQQDGQKSRASSIPSDPRSLTESLESKVDQTVKQVPRNLSSQSVLPYRPRPPAPQIDASK